MKAGNSDVIGRSSLSTWYRALDMESGCEVLLKAYKDESCQRGERTPRGGSQRRFRQQVTTLQELQRPFEPPPDAALWNEALAGLSPLAFFPRLLDCSMDTYNNPGPDPDDGGMYLVTDCPQHNLKDYVELKREVHGGSLPADELSKLSRALLTASAALHARNLVHFCLGLESFAVLGGELKLFYLDGCVRAGTNMSLDEPFATRPVPTRCAPELSRFLAERDEHQLIDASPSLDVWSVGIMLCELAGFKTDIEDMYASCDSCLDFFKQVGNLQDAPIAASGIPDDLAEFSDFICENLLVCDRTRRKTLAQCLYHRIFSKPGSPEKPAQKRGDDPTMYDDLATHVRNASYLRELRE